MSVSVGLRHETLEALLRGTLRWRRALETLLWCTSWVGLVLKTCESSRQRGTRLWLETRLRRKTGLRWETSRRRKTRLRRKAGLWRKTRLWRRAKWVQVRLRPSCPRSPRVRPLRRRKWACVPSILLCLLDLQLEAAFLL